ncbi:MAG TPA: transporter substrate-binding domain-containing protein, partial [Epsilonproteobacteria bacterium]|nr:transporter substrate-binding domain-containing protein [Campylobacterota bacterium]
MPFPCFPNHIILDIESYKGYMMRKKLLFSLLTLTLGTTANVQANFELDRHIKKFGSEKEESKPLMKKVFTRQTDDLDEMLKRKSIRVLVVNSEAFYGIEKGKAAGIYHDAIIALEKQINQKYPHKNKHIKTKLIPIPVTREFLIPALNAGYGDVAIADNTITKRRQEQVAFSEPFASGINEVLVTNSAMTGITSFEDLSGREVYVKPS